MVMFRFISDPGHGWLEVPRSELVALKLTDKISNYSYQKNDMIYLEEDVDAYVFLCAYKEVKGKTVNFFEVFQENCPIRDYSSYTE